MPHHDIWQFLIFCHQLVAGIDDILGRRALVDFHADILHLQVRGNGGIDDADILAGNREFIYRHAVVSDVCLAQFGLISRGTVENAVCPRAVGRQDNESRERYIDLDQRLKEFVFL